MSLGWSRVEETTVHGTLLALALSAYLFSPSFRVFARFWDLASGPTVTTLLEKEGPGLDPDGARRSTSALEEGPGLDPSGHS